MKNGIAILVIMFLILISGLAGYFLAKTEKKPASVIFIPEQKYISKLDSFKSVVSVKEDSLLILKNMLSSYSRNRLKKEDPTPFDTLKTDINTFQDIVRIQDTLRAIDARQIVFIRSELDDTALKLADFQLRYQTDMDRQKRSKLRVFLSGVGVGAGTILAAILIF